jgi:hypothetical protein
VIEGLVRSESGKIHLASCEKVKLLKEPLPVPRERAVESHRWAMCCYSRISTVVSGHSDAASHPDETTL